MSNPSSVNCFPSPGHLTSTVPSLSRKDGTIIEEQETRTRVYYNPPVQGLRPPEQFIHTQFTNPQFQNRNIKSVPLSRHQHPSNFTREQQTPQHNNQLSPAGSDTPVSAVSSSDPYFSTPSSTDVPQITLHHLPNTVATPMVTNTQFQRNPNSPLPPFNHFMQADQHSLFRQAQPSSARSQNNTLTANTSVYTRRSSNQPDTASFPPASGIYEGNTGPAPLPNHLAPHRFNQAPQEQYQQLVPQVPYPASRSNALTPDTSATQAVATRSVSDMSQVTTVTTEHHSPTNKSGQQMKAIAQAVTKGITDQALPILRERLEREASDAVKAMMPAVKEEVFQMVSELITTIIPSMQSHLTTSLSGAAKSSMKDMLEKTRKQFLKYSTVILKEAREEQSRALEETVSKFKEQQERTQAILNQTVETFKNVSDAIIAKMHSHLTTSLSGPAKPSMKDMLEQTRKQFLEDSTLMLQEAMEEQARALEATVSKFKEQQEKTQATSDQTVEEFKKALDGLNQLINSHTETLQQTAQSAIRSSISPEIDPPETIEEATLPASQRMTPEHSDGPLTKKMRTSKESLSLPVFDVQIKRTHPEMERLSSEVSKALGIRKLTINEATTGKILFLAARLINDDKEPLVQAAKPKPKRVSSNLNHQEIMKAEKVKVKKMKDETNTGFTELANSVRNFWEKNDPTLTPSDSSDPYTIITEACSILNDQNINDPERSSVKKLSLRNAGKRANLHEYYKSAKKLLAQEKKVQQ